MTAVSPNRTEPILISLFARQPWPYKPFTMFILCKRNVTRKTQSNQLDDQIQPIYFTRAMTGYYQA